jgi:hypothetical protein
MRANHGVRTIRPTPYFDAALAIRSHTLEMHPRQRIELDEALIR